MRKIIIAAALTAALTLGAVPAFAANPASTSIMVTTDPSKISVEVPVTLPVTADANGGALTVVPTNYQLKNDSVYKVKVSNIVAAETTEWKLAATSIAGNALPVKGGTVGDIELKLTPTGVASALAWQVSTAAQADPTKWSIVGRTTAGTPVPFPITISGSSSAVKKMSDPAVEAIKVTFTVAPDPSA